jgi:signal transduction histidine kinase
VHACQPLKASASSCVGGAGMPSFSALVHEVQGRLSSIAVFTDELRMHAERHKAGNSEDRISRISRNVNELQRIVDAIRRLNDGSPPQRVRIDLSALAAQVVKAHVDRSPTFGKAKIWIQSSISITGDLDQISIVLENIIGNALKFSARREIPEVRVTTTSEPDAVIVHVSDNGVGIAPEDGRRIFEPFTRCHSGFAGSGIGLALARDIVDRHRGRIWATGEPGLGTTVSFTI